MKELIEKIKLAISKGITCNPETGQVFGNTGKELTYKINGYPTIGFNHEGKVYKIGSHQFIFYIVHNKCVKLIDHINTITTDNRISNLRELDNSGNKRNSNKIKGYYYNKQNKKWHAQIVVNRKVEYLGEFDCPLLAGMAYKKRRNELGL